MNSEYVYRGVKDLILLPPTYASMKLEKDDPDAPFRLTSRMSNLAVLIFDQVFFSLETGLMFIPAFSSKGGEGRYGYEDKRGRTHK